MSQSELLPMLAPLVLVELALIALALRDLIKREQVRFDNKLLWGAIIVLFSVIGPIAYFTLGREEN